MKFLKPVFRSLASIFLAFIAPADHLTKASADHTEGPRHLFETYCLGCHDELSAEGGFDLSEFLKLNHSDFKAPFANLATRIMPPSGEEMPSESERRKMLEYLSGLDSAKSASVHRRRSRRELIASLNDLCGTNLDFSDKIPDDQGTYPYESDQRILLSKEVLRSYFDVVDDVLDIALPVEGFPAEQTWVTSKLRNAHFTYSRHYKETEEGILFAWTRANNGNSYSYFYDGFEPPVEGWYDLTFDAKKVGDFDEDVTLQVYTGKYYYADDRPQTQRLLGVISLGNREFEETSLRAYLRPGENVSVHCYSSHNWRQSPVTQGVLIKQLAVRGPVLDAWPPKSYDLIFGDLPVQAVSTRESELQVHETILEQIGGSFSVSSQQEGMEKGKLQDGSIQTFWHTQFSPTLAPPPHYVVFENPNRSEILGMNYSTWVGGNGNGLVKSYTVLASADGVEWDQVLASGGLDVSLVNEQAIMFSEPTDEPFLMFRIDASKSIDGRSLASIGKLDLIIAGSREIRHDLVSVKASTEEELISVVKRFSHRALGVQVSEKELDSYLIPALNDFEKNGNFVRATKIGLKAILCSPRFMMVPTQDYPTYEDSANLLARVFWLSIPDMTLTEVNATRMTRDDLRPVVYAEVDRLLSHPESDRFVRSLADQWLNLKDWDEISPSLKLYPQYDDLIHYYLPLELVAYLGFCIRENRPITDLVDSCYGFLNQRLASHYEVEPIIGQNLRRIEYPSNSKRGGLLTTGAISKLTTDGFQTSPILRGAWVVKHLLGIPLPPPPENVSALESGDELEAETLRERIAKHKDSDSCAGCHRRMDPYGFALECLDATGKWRQSYAAEKPHSGTFTYRLDGYRRILGRVDTTCEIDGEKFVDLNQWKNHLTQNHHRLSYNFARQFYHFVNGREPDLRQNLRLLDVIDATQGVCRIRDLMCEVLIESILSDQAN